MNRGQLMLTLAIASIFAFLGGLLSSQLFITQPLFGQEKLIYKAPVAKKASSVRVDEVRAKRIVVIDENNRHLASFGADSNSTYLYLNNLGGQKRLVLRAYNQEAVVRFFDRNFRIIAELPSSHGKTRLSIPTVKRIGVFQDIKDDMDARQADLKTIQAQIEEILISLEKLKKRLEGN